jgi:MFS family permease
MIPLLLTIMGALRDVPVEPPTHFEIWKSLRGLLRHRNVRWVTGAQLILQIFFAWMVIYTPIYLHEYIGFSWESIGVLFTIMLLPFIIFEIPIGKLADERYGEKEFMIFGFVVMVLSLLLFPLITTASFGLWAFVLFLTRVGGSFVEITSESYFFKQVAGADSDWISLFRATRSIGYIVAPIFAGICIIFLPFQFMFTALAIVCSVGIFFARKLEDTL